MKFIIETKDFLQGLQIVEKAGKLCYIKTCEDGISLKTSRTTFSIYTFVEAEVLEEGETLLSCKDLINYVGRCNDKIQIETKNNKLLVENALFKVYDSSNYPPFPKKADNYSHHLSDFCTKIRQIMTCCDKREQQLFTGNIVFEGDYLYSTDGIRIGVIRCPHSNFPKIIIPSLVFFPMMKWDEVDIAISQEQKMVYFTNGKTTIISQLINVKYPDCIRTINSSRVGIKETIEIPLLDLLKICEKACIFNSFSVKFMLGEEGITVISVGEAGSFKENLEIDLSIETEEEFYCNAKFLVDALKSMQAEKDSKVLVHLCSFGSYIMVLLEKEDFQYLIAPQKK